MDHQQIIALIRRAKLKLVNGKVRKVKVDNNRLHAASARFLSQQAISYQTLPSREDNGRKGKVGQDPNIIRHGILPASKRTAMDLIKNAPEVNSLDETNIPDDYQFEIFRLRQRIAELETIVRDKNGRLSQALGALEDELLFWRTFLHEHIGESIGELQKRIGRLKSTVAYIQDVQPHIIPPLDLPARWKKS